MPPKLLGDHTDPEKVTGRDVVYGGIEFIPSRQFVEESDCSCDGFRRLKTSVGNQQIHDPKAMDEGLRRNTRHGYITVSTFMYYSGQKRNSAKNFLDSLCEGDHLSPCKPLPFSLFPAFFSLQRAVL